MTMIPPRAILSLLLLLFGTFGPLGNLGIEGARVGASAAPPIPCPDNRLSNPGFEEGFSGRGRVDSVTALGWEPWHEVVSGGVARPVWWAQRGAAPDEALFVRDGLWSQGLTEQSVLQSAGVWQRAMVTPGNRLVAAAWGRGWASRGDDPTRSVPSGRYLLAIGVDPLGGRDSTAARIRWSNPVTVTDTWLPLSVEISAEASAATVFLRGQPIDALRNNAAYWDGACLLDLDPLAAPAAGPSATPQPSPTWDPEQPSPTPDLLQVQATLIAQVASTARSVDLAARATERAGLPAARMAPVIGGLSVPAGGYDPGRRASGPAPLSLVDEQGEAPRPDLLAWLIDHSGIGVIALAALLSGLLFGWARPESKGERDARERKG